MKTSRDGRSLKLRTMQCGAWVSQKSWARRYSPSPSPHRPRSSHGVVAGGAGGCRTGPRAPRPVAPHLRPAEKQRAAPPNQRPVCRGGVAVLPARCSLGSHVTPRCWRLVPRTCRHPLSRRSRSGSSPYEPMRCHRITCTTSISDFGFKVLVINLSTCFSPKK